MRKSWVAAAILVVAGLVLADGKPGLVRTKAGVVYDGTVDEKTDTVVVNVRGIDTSLTRDEVDSITYGTFDERWTAAYDALAKTDAAGRVAAGRQAFDMQRYDLAERALREAQAIEPNNAETAELLKTTMNQRRLESVKTVPTTPGTTATPASTATTKPAAGWNLLTADQVNRVKQLELRDTETKTRVAFSNNVQKHFYDSNPRLANEFPSFQAFRSASSVVQAGRIIRDGAPELAKDVKIVNDPEIIADFRNSVQSLILQGCATSQCHGGSGAAAMKFALVSPAAEPAATYTNFYVLQSTKMSRPGGAKPLSQTGGNTVVPDVAFMIDRIRPDQSALLQFGLSDQYAEMKHPRVRGYNGIFPRGRDDPKYKAILDFVQKLTPVQPDYGFDYKLERKGPTTATTQP
ncbi:MAG: hypothetical protein JWM57_540 [Phycisphaerales bacterium]|nr:hypothetical protein [Phycisphaerales bacterium]